MKKRSFGLFLFALFGATSLFSQPQIAIQGAQLSPLFPPAKKVHPHAIDHFSSPRIPLKSIGLKNSSSTNWSGYAALTMSSLVAPKVNSVSKVSGQWTIPRLHKSETRETYSSVWVGIDGYSNTTVEQIGTAQEWYNDKQHTYAWIELYPAYPYEIASFPTHVGDRIAASVTSKKGSHVFTLTIHNKTRNRTATITTYQPDALCQSADWIVEAPSSDTNTAVLPLAKFSKITMSHCFATIDGIHGSINGHHREHDAITMRTENNITKAKPSHLSAYGSRFSVTWHHE